MVLVDSIRFHKKSTKAAYYTISCAIVQVFNTGLLLVVSSGDVSSTFLKAFKTGNGIYKDINAAWYADVGGNLIYTYIFVLVWPLIDWPMYWFIGKIF